MFDYCNFTIYPTLLTPHLVNDHDLSLFDPITILKFVSYEQSYAPANLV